MRIIYTSGHFNLNCLRSMVKVYYLFLLISLTNFDKNFFVSRAKDPKYLSLVHSIPSTDKTMFHDQFTVCIKILERIL